MVEDTCDPHAGAVETGSAEGAGQIVPEAPGLRLVPAVGADVGRVRIWIRDGTGPVGPGAVMGPDEAEDLAEALLAAAQAARLPVPPAGRRGHSADAADPGARAREGA